MIINEIKPMQIFSSPTVLASNTLTSSRLIGYLWNSPQELDIILEFQYPRFDDFIYSRISNCYLPKTQKFRALRTREGLFPSNIPISDEIANSPVSDATSETVQLKITFSLISKRPGLDISGFLCSTQQKDYDEWICFRQVLQENQQPMTLYTSTISQPGKNMPKYCYLSSLFCSLQSNLCISPCQCSSSLNLLSYNGPLSRLLNDK